MYNAEEILEIARRSISIEAQALANLVNKLDNQFSDAIEMILGSQGRLIITGIGKSAIIGQKITATMNSTGTPALFMHAADAVHGDLGMVQSKEVVLCLSQSGNTPEIKALAPLIKRSQNHLIAICGNPDSFLARQANLVISSEIDTEACPLNLAPTTSTAAQLALGDAIAICLLESRGFSKDDFARYHPGGNLGKKLYLRVNDLVSRDNAPSVSVESGLKDIILEITGKRLGATVVTDEKEILGIITDGDLRRMLEREVRTEDLRADQIMQKNPKCIDQAELALEALEMMKQNSISQLVVMNGKEYLGMVHIHDLMREGIL